MMKSKKQKITKLNLDEELLREAAEIEEEIKNVPLEENPVDKERLRSAILMQVLQEERKKQQKRSARRRVAQGAAVFAVIMTGIFGLSMTSQANRIFLVEKVEEFFSGRTEVAVENETIEPANLDERKARDDIEQTLEVDVPEFFYIPEGMKFSGYELFDDVNIARLYYSFQNKIITFTISGSEENAAVNRSIDGEMIESFVAKKDQIKIELWQLSNNINEETAYCAQWINKNNYYLISGSIKLEEIKKILESMAY